MITKGDIPALRALWQQAFGDSDALLDKFFSVGFSFDRCNCVRKEGKIAAALYWFDCRWMGKKIAYIYAVATEKSLQGQGLCRKLMEDTHKLLQKQGYCGAALVPGTEKLAALYEKFGYRGFCPVEHAGVREEKFPAAEAISPAEYAALRQELLGENAVLQDITALNFLATYGGFYKGEKSCFCGFWDDDIFHFEEILDASRQKTGSVQAMYLQLDGDETLPNYFAIPLI